MRCLKLPNKEKHSKHIKKHSHTWITKKKMSSIKSFHKKPKTHTILSQSIVWRSIRKLMVKYPKRSIWDFLWVISTGPGTAELFVFYVLKVCLMGTIMIGLLLIRKIVYRSILKSIVPFVSFIRILVLGCWWEWDLYPEKISLRNTGTFYHHHL